MDVVNLPADEEVPAWKLRLNVSDKFFAVDPNDV